MIATLQFHHWHHSADIEAYNKNYAGELPLLDMIFGTYHLPKDRLPKTYGILEMVPTGYFGQLLYPFRRAPLGRVSD